MFVFYILSLHKTFQSMPLRQTDCLNLANLGTCGHSFFLIAFLIPNSRKGIADEVCVSPSTVCREIKCNGNPRSYNPETANRRALRKRDRLRLPRKYTHEMERETHRPIEEKQWPPKQIIVYCKANGGNLWKWTRHRMKYPHRALYSYKTPMPNRTDIGQRPEEVDGKRLWGFEMDLIVGANGKQAMLTLMDRHTNMGMIPS